MATMRDVEGLKKRIEDKLAAVEERKRAKHEKHNEFIMDIKERQKRFRETAEPVISEIIMPRLRQLATYFENAEFVEEEGRSRQHQRLHFRHTKRYPASTNLELTFGCDAQLENVIVSFNVEILPVIVKFDRHQEITFPLAVVNEHQLTSWVDDRICQFVETYLQLEHADEFHGEHLETDPVCGMKVVRTFAAAEMEFNGKTYYFCVKSCYEKFAEDPNRYLIAGDE